jgi:hypothetical protein
VKHPEKKVENVEEPLVKNSKQGKHLDFNFLIRYKNAQEARESIDEDKCWQKGNKTESGSVTKQVYKCKFNKSSGCEAKCYLLYHDDDSVTLDSIYALFQKPKQIHAYFQRLITILSIKKF